MNLDLFPFPYIINSKKKDGSIFRWPDVCNNCRHNDCEEAHIDTLFTCPYGFDYQKVHKNITIAGVLIKDTPFINKVKSKRFKKYPNSVTSHVMFNSATSKLKEAIAEEINSIQIEKNKIIDEYVEKEQYKIDFLEKMRPDILKGLSFVHDYKQINTQISHNINVIIEEHYPGDSIEDKIDNASPYEKAIYYASKFLEEKLNVAKFLLQPEWLEKESDCKEFRFHGLVLKYRRIYAPRFDKKRIAVNLFGKSNDEINANPQAVSVIPHTLIDNAAKYSPQGGHIDIRFNDTDDGIEFSVSSYGPKLNQNELKKLFTPFYRGENAKKIEEDGVGYGLYISQLIAKIHLGTEITFSQDTRKRDDGQYWTTFSILIPFKARVLKQS
jgi:signal transduction histidine kinase